MIKKLTLIFLALIPIVLFSQTQEEKIKQLEEKIKKLEMEISQIQAQSEETQRLRQEIEAIKEEIRRLRIEVAMPEIELKSYFGLGPAASKIYYTPKGLSIAGYGEITYENFIDRSKTDRGDVLRFIPTSATNFRKRYLLTQNLKLSTLELEMSEVENQKFMLNSYMLIS
jgi:hypothetical protein